MITSKDNATFKNLMKLHQKKYRQATKTFLIEGAHLVSEAIQAGFASEILMCVEEPNDENDARNIKTTYLNRNLFEKLALTKTPQNIMAVCKMKELEIVGHNRLLLLDNIQDPGNLGTLIRSALAFSFDGVILSETTVDVYNEKVIRATQGAIFNIPIIRRNLPQYMLDLKSKDVHVYGTSVKDAQFLKKIGAQSKMAFVLGSEGAGVSDEVLALVDENVMIEMGAFSESLNVAVAGGIIMHYFSN